MNKLIVKIISQNLNKFGSKNLIDTYLTIWLINEMIALETLSITFHALGDLTRLKKL